MPITSLPNGTLLIQAAEDFGGFYQVETVQASVYRVTGNTADTIYDYGLVGAGQDFHVPNPVVTAPTEPVSKTRPTNSQMRDDIATKQKRIHQEIAKLRQGNKSLMSFAVAWQRLQSTRPELFQGLDDVVVHPD